MTRRALATLALTAAAGAQAPFTTGSTVTYTLHFHEIGGNTNGTIEPGESALIQLDVSFSNQNTTATYSPPTPLPGSGTIRGLGSGFIDLNGTANNGGNANGVWNTDYVNPGLGPVRDGWEVGPSGYWGTPAGGGSQLRNIQFGQFPLNAASIVTTNPLDLMYQALWTPASYATRTVTFTVAPAFSSNGLASSIMFKTSTTGVADVICASDFGSVSIPIIPAPATALLLAAPLLARRRRTGTPR